jgi:hypothetical protein
LRSRRAAAAVLVAGALAMAGLGAYATVARSAIPLAWHGTVTRVEARREKHPGVDDAWFVTVDGRATHVDAALATSLRPGQRVEKDPWNRTLLVDGTPRRLALSRDARRMLLLAPLLVLAVYVTVSVPFIVSGWKSQTNS